jgi:hypothetical protein
MMTLWEIITAYISGVTGTSGTSMSYKKKRSYWAELKRNIDHQAKRNQK